MVAERYLAVMNKTSSLREIFADRVLAVPDYQRGYAWEEVQWDDFLGDLDLLENGNRHFTGTVVLHPSVRPVPSAEGDLRGLDVVDGQQRLTTCFIVLACIAGLGQDDPLLSFRDDLGERRRRLRLGRDAHAYWDRVVLANAPSPDAPSIEAHHRLIRARRWFDSRLAERSEEERQSLRNKVVEGLQFLVFEVEEAAEVGVVFETMNNRGRPLSELEKVKNYLLFVAARLERGGSRLAETINDTWTSILEHLSRGGIGTPEHENTLLRVHWCLAYDANVRRWRGSGTIKERFDLRIYRRKHSDLFADIGDYLRGLRNVASALTDVLRPDRDAAFGAFSREHAARARHWGLRLDRVGVIAPFQALLVAARLRLTPAQYVEISMLCERYAFRVYRLGGKRSNAGAVQLRGLAHRLYMNNAGAGAVGLAIRRTAERYFSTDAYSRWWNTLGGEDNNWYGWNGLKYLLYEWECHLASLDKDRQVKLRWSRVTANSLLTIEHVLPQTPTDPYWRERFSDSDHEELVGDLGNMTITEDNSHYSNKAYPDKRGEAGWKKPCYLRANTFSERDLAAAEDWNRGAIEARRARMVAWGRERWFLEPCPEEERSVRRSTRRKGNKKLMEAAAALINGRTKDLVEAGVLSEDGVWVYAGRCLVSEHRMEGVGKVGLDVYFESIGGRDPELVVRLINRERTTEAKRAALRLWGAAVLEALEPVLVDVEYEPHGRDRLPHWVGQEPAEVEEGWSAEQIAAVGEGVLRAVVRTLDLAAPG